MTEIPRRKDKPEPPEWLTGIAKEIFLRHPRRRRDCGLSEIIVHLQEILTYQRVPPLEQQAYLTALAARHSRWSKCEQWTKSDGEYAKGLANWLAKTMKRYESEPPVAWAEPRLIGR